MKFVRPRKFKGSLKREQEASLVLKMNLLLLVMEKNSTKEKKIQCYFRRIMAKLQMIMLW